MMDVAELLIISCPKCGDANEIEELQIPTEATVRPCSNKDCDHKINITLKVI